MTSRSEKRSLFGRELDLRLDEKGMTASGLAEAVDSPQPYVSQLMTGVRKAQPEWIDLVADAMKLTSEQRAALHHAAALDHGFRLDPVPPARRRG